MSQTKDHVNLVVIGHTKAGKSTIAGRLMHDCGALDDDTIAELERNCKEASNVGQESMKYAWVFDHLQAERESGCSINLTTRELETPSRQVTLTDVPGHFDFVKTMIRGAFEADCALLVISADENELDEGVRWDGQTFEHVRVARALEIPRLIVAVNKMDICNWSEARFKEIVKTTTRFLRREGYDISQITFIPVSGYEGQNISSLKDDLSWYHGTSLIDAIDAIRKWHKYRDDKPLRLPIRDVYRLPDIGTVLVGTVESGIITTGMSIIIAPTGITAKVLSLESHRKRIEEGRPGQLVAFHPGVEADFRRGQVVCDSENQPASQCSSFTAFFTKYRYHDHLKPRHIRNGYTPVVHCHTAQVPCKFELLRLNTIGTSNQGGGVEENPELISSGHTGLVKLTPLKPLCVETRDSASMPFSRIIVRDHGRIIGTGVIKSVENCQ